MIAKKQMAGVLGLLKASLSLHTAYLRAVLDSRPGQVGSEGEDNQALPQQHGPSMSVSVKATEDAARNLKTSIQKCTELLGQLKLEIGFAKRRLDGESSSQRTLAVYRNDCNRSFFLSQDCPLLRLSCSP